MYVTTENAPLTGSRRAVTLPVTIRRSRSRRHPGVRVTLDQAASGRGDDHGGLVPKGRHCRVKRNGRRLFFNKSRPKAEPEVGVPRGREEEAKAVLEACQAQKSSAISSGCLPTRE